MDVDKNLIKCRCNHLTDFVLTKGKNVRICTILCIAGEFASLDCRCTACSSCPFGEYSSGGCDGKTDNVCNWCGSSEIICFIN